MKILPTFVQAAKLPSESESTSISISSSTLAFMATTENLVDDLCMGLECGLMGRKRQEKNRAVVSKEDLQLYGTTVLDDAYKLTDERNHSLLHSFQEDDAATFSDASSSIYSGITFESGTTKDEIEIDLIGVPAGANDADDEQNEQPLQPSTTSAVFELDTILSNLRISAIEVKVDETRATRSSNDNSGSANRPDQMANERAPPSQTGTQLAVNEKFSPSRDRKRPRKTIINRIKKTTKQSRKAFHTRIKKSVETARAKYSRNQMTARSGSQTALERVSTTAVEEVLKHRMAAQMWSRSVMKQAQEEKQKKEAYGLRRLPPTQRLSNAWMLAMDNIIDDSLSETIESSSLSGTDPRTRESDETSTIEVVVAPSSVRAQRPFHRKAGAALVNFLSRYIRLKKRRKNGNNYQRTNES